MRSPRTLRALAPLAALALLGACSDDADDDPMGGETTETTESTDGDTTETTEATDGGGSEELPEGWQLVEGDGVAIGVPEDWKDVPLDELELGAEELQEVLPEADEALMNQAAQVVQQGGVLLVFGPTVDGFTDNLNIIEMPVAAEVDQLEQEAEMGLNAVGAQLDSSEVVELPLGEAVRVAYQLEAQGPDGPYAVYGVQYYLSTGGSTYVLTVSSGSDPGSMADDMAMSFEVR